MDFINDAQQKARETRDPFCFTSKHSVFGPYSLLTGTKDEDESCIECVSAEVVRYDKLIAKIYDDNAEYLTPLCMIIDAKTEQPFSIRSHVVMITDPRRLGDFINNWKAAGIEVPDYEVKIIEHDHDFDNKVSAIFRSGLGIVVDPLLDQNQNPAKGIPVVDMRSIIGDKYNDIPW